MWLYVDDKFAFHFINCDWMLLGGPGQMRFGCLPGGRWRDLRGARPFRGRELTGEKKRENKLFSRREAVVGIRRRKSLFCVLYRV